MDKIKVLHITNGADVGGISNVILNYYRNIDRTKFQFDFVIPPGTFGRNGKELEGLGSRFYTLPPKGSHPLSFIKELRKLIKLNQYDIVHAHQHSSSYFPLFIALSCGVKCRVAQCHSFMLGESVVTKIKRYVGIVLNDLASNLRFACTEEAAGHLFGKRLKRFFPVTILANGVEPDNFLYSNDARSLARSELKIDSRTIVYGIVGRMTEEKNHKYLIDVMSDLIKVKQDVRLLMVGDGPLRKELESYARNKGVANYVVFAGKRPDLVNMLCLMDVFTLPSIYEGSPVSAVEAVANGLPVILSSSITKDLKVLSNITYLDTAPNNCDKWAKTIIELSAKGRSVDSVSIINQNGFNVSYITKKLEDCYSKMINSSER